MRKPNALQRSLHYLLMIPSVTAFAAPRVHHLDRAILKLTRGKFALSRLLGWNIVQLTTIGARTRQPRTLPLVGIFDRGKIAIVASSFGRPRNPGWYYNLKAHPECEVRCGDRSGTYIARETAASEHERYWRMAVDLYAGYEKYRQRAQPRRIPVMVLEPLQVMRG